MKATSLSYRTFHLMPPKSICHLQTIENVPDWAHMHNGVSQSGRFPADARFKMSADFPKDIKLADALINIEGFLVFSERFVDFLSKENALKNNEVLPVAIINHKGRPEKAKYFIVHQVNRPKCVDESKTVGDKSQIEKSQYQHMHKLVLLDGNVDPDVCILRAAEYPDAALFRADLAEKITTGGFTGGIEFFGLDEFDDDVRFNILMARHGG